MPLPIQFEEKLKQLKENREIMNKDLLTLEYYLWLEKNGIKNPWIHIVGVIKPIKNHRNPKYRNWNLFLILRLTLRRSKL